MQDLLQNFVWQILKHSLSFFLSALPISDCWENLQFEALVELLWNCGMPQTIISFSSFLFFFDFNKNEIRSQSYRLEFVKSKPKSIGLDFYRWRSRRQKKKNRGTEDQIKSITEDQIGKEEEERKKNRGPNWAGRKRIRSGRKKKRIEEEEEEEEEVYSWNVENGEQKF